MGLNASTYTTDWTIDFTACQEGTNYVSVRVYDYFGHEATVTDIFYVRKNTSAPGFSIGGFAVGVMIAIVAGVEVVVAMAWVRKEKRAKLSR